MTGPYSISGRPRRRAAALFTALALSLSGFVLPTTATAQEEEPAPAEASPAPLAESASAEPSVEPIADAASDETNIEVVAEEPEPSQGPAPSEDPTHSEDPAPFEDPAPSEDPIPSEDRASTDPAPSEEPAPSEVQAPTSAEGDAEAGPVVTLEAPEAQQQPLARAAAAPRITASPEKTTAPINQTVNVKGSLSGFSGAVAVRTEAWVDNKRWSIHQRKNFTGSYSMPLAFRAAQAGTVKWRVVATSGSITVSSQEFTLTRTIPKVTATPSATSALVNQTVNVNGTVTGFGGPVEIRTEVWVSNNRWSIHQRKSVTGSYSMPLAFRANQAGTLKWRVVASKGAISVASSAFSVTRRNSSSTTIAGASGPLSVINAKPNVTHPAYINERASALGITGRITLKKSTGANVNISREAQYNAYQAMRTIRTAHWPGVSASDKVKLAQIAVLTMAQESNFGTSASSRQPNSHGDTGPFQMRALVGWHADGRSVAENNRILQSIPYSTLTLVEGHIVGVSGGPSRVGYRIPGVFSKANWRTQEAWRTSVAVQVPATWTYPLSAAWEPVAKTLVSNLYKR